MARNNELIRLAKKAAGTWRNTHEYQQAAQIIDMLVDELEKSTLTQPNEPLTMEQLRESPHGKIKDSTLESICNRANEIASRPPEGEEKYDA